MCECPLRREWVDDATTLLYRHIGGGGWEWVGDATTLLYIRLGVGGREWVGDATTLIYMLIGGGGREWVGDAAAVKRIGWLAWRRELAVNRRWCLGRGRGGWVVGGGNTFHLL